MSMKSLNYWAMNPKCEKSPEPMSVVDATAKRVYLSGSRTVGSSSDEVGVNSAYETLGFEKMNTKTIPDPENVPRADPLVLKPMQVAWSVETCSPNLVASVSDDGTALVEFEALLWTTC